MKKTSVKFYVLFLISVFIISCDKSNDRTEEAEYTIAVLTWSLAEEFGVDIVEGAKSKAQEIGGIKIVSPDPAGDMQKEIAIIEDLIQQKVSAIAIAPVDANAIIPYIEKIMDAGIVVVIVNTLLNSTQEPHQKKKNLVVYF